MKIAVTGYKGRLGSELIKMGCEPLDCDVTDLQSIELAIHFVKPDVIINCAAYINVDGCENDDLYKRALAVNTWGVSKLRDAFDGKLIHISTDYVFPGDRGPYPETYIKIFPVNGYGFSKVGGEIILQTHSNKNTIIIRTTGLYGGCSKKPDFVSMILDNLKDGKEIKVTDELKGNQTYVPHLAKALLYCAKTDGLPMIVNVGSKEVISRYSFAKKIAKIFKYSQELIIPSTNREIPDWIAKRPSKGGLKVTLAEKLKVPIFTIEDGLTEYKDVVC